MVAGLAGGIGFMYFSFSYAGHLPTMTIVPRIHPRPFLPGGLERGRHRAPSGGRPPARPRRPASWTSRSPPATPRSARSTGLPSATTPARTKVRPATTPYDVAVVGRRGDVVLLDDECLEPTEVPAADFVAARAANRKSRARMLVVEPESRTVDLVPAIRASLAVTVHDLVEDVMPNNFAGNFGLRGLAKWANAVADRRKKGWARLFDSSAAHVDSHAAAVRLPHHGVLVPGAMRPLYADFLDGGRGRRVGDPRSREAAVPVRPRRRAVVARSPRPPRLVTFWPRTDLVRAAAGAAVRFRERGGPGAPRALSREETRGVHRGAGPGRRRTGRARLDAVAELAVRGGGCWSGRRAPRWRVAGSGLVASRRCPFSAPPIRCPVVRSACSSPGPAARARPRLPAPWPRCSTARTSSSTPCTTARAGRSARTFEDDVHRVVGGASAG